MFAAAQQYPAGADPDDVVTADLTDNGIMDVVVANYGVTSTASSPATGGISVLMGTGVSSPAFGAPTFYSVATPIQSVAVGDLNGDGYPDVVGVGEDSNYVYVWMNNGNGTLANPVGYAVGSHPEGVAIADVNGDKSPDIITADQGVATGGSVDVLLNNGDGTFDVPKTGASDAIAYDGGPNPDALAVGDLNGDGYPDIVTVDPENDEVHVLLNLGAAKTKDNTSEAGTFPATPTDYLTDTTGRSVTIGDVNNDARPDIIVANLRSADIGVLLNDGQGLFQGQITYKTGAFPFGVVSADINGDNRPDLIIAASRDNAVGILVHNGSGAYNNGGTDATPREFSAGTPLTGGDGVVAPEAVAVADVNGDGKPDIITANFNTDSIGVLINETVFPQLIKTTVTLTPSLSTVQVGGTLTLTATISPAPSVADSAGRVVQFVDGDRVLGIATLTPAGTATITTTFSKLPPGAAADDTSAMTSIFARYNGNAHYSPSVAAVNETVVTSGVATPLVAATAVALTGRAGRAVPFVPGDTGSAAVTVTDQGAGRATGPVTVDLSVAPADDLAAAMPISTIGNATFTVNLVGGHSKTFPVRFTLPADLTGGGYTILAALVPAGTTPAAYVNPAVAATATAASLVLAFGAVGTHRHYALSTTLPNGAAVTLSITGPGTASVDEPGGGALDLSVADTTGGSTVSVVVDGGGPVTISDFTDNYRLGGLIAPDVTLAGDPTVGSVGQISLATGITQLTLAGVTDADIGNGPLGHAALSLGTVTDTALSSAGSLQSLTVTSWSNTAGDAIVAPGIRGAITSTGDFGPLLVLSGARMPVALGSASIGGNLDSSEWSIGTTVGPIQVGGNVTSVLAAKAFGDIVIGGSLTDADILAGTAFGRNGVLGGGDDVFNVGRITSVQVGGNVTGSLVAAGFKPASDDPFTPVGGTLIRGGKIGAITVNGTVDAASRFAAVSLPAIT